MNKSKEEDDSMNSPKITVLKNGPYLVCGNIPLYEYIIVPDGNGVRYEQGRKFPRTERYLLCRCGQSATMPFCDGAHTKCGYKGTETAPLVFGEDCIVTYQGNGYILKDIEQLCAFARFCHKEAGDVWELTEMSTANPDFVRDAIEGSCDCPAGRLIILDEKTGEDIEPEYEPSIVILQDPERHCSGPIWVRGGIPIESADNRQYEVRNRVTLCRCGKSRNMPFCDSSHIIYGFQEKV